MPDAHTEWYKPFLTLFFSFMLYKPINSITLSLCHWLSDDTFEYTDIWGFHSKVAAGSSLDAAYAKQQIYYVLICCFENNTNEKFNLYQFSFNLRKYNAKCLLKQCDMIRSNLHQKTKYREFNQIQFSHNWDQWSVTISPDES